MQFNAELKQPEGESAAALPAQRARRLPAARLSSLCELACVSSVRMQMLLQPLVQWCPVRAIKMQWFTSLGEDLAAQTFLLDVDSLQLVDTGPSLLI